MAGKSVFVSTIGSEADFTYCTAEWAQLLRAAALKVATLRFTPQDATEFPLFDAKRHEMEAGCDVLLVEAPALMAPLTDDYFAIDYAAGHALPIALVSNGDPGLAVLALEAIRRRAIMLDALLCLSTTPQQRAFLSRYLRKHFPTSPIIDIPKQQE